MMRCSHRLLLAAFLCVGCGSVKGSQLTDGPPPIDATTRGTVHVTVLDPAGTGAPAVGASVVFLDPDGTLVKKASTDSAGKADADVLPGASVTAIALVNTSTALQTVLAVKPGDDLVIGSKQIDSSTAGDFSITYPAFTGATSYSVVSPCNTTSFPAPAAGGPPPTAKITIFNSCRLDAMELLVVAQGGNGPLASISKPGVAFMPNGSTTITGNYAGLRNFTASYTNIDPVITNLNTTRAVPDAFGFTTSQATAMPGTSAVVNITGPVGTGGDVVTQALSTTGSRQTVRQEISGSAVTYGLDVGATLLPWIKPPSYDATTGKVLVPLDTTGASSTKPDLFRLILSYRRVDANNVTHTFAWQVFGPEAADIVLPTLPADLGGIGPTASDAVTVSTAFMFEADSVAGYDAIRNDLSTAIQLYGGARPPATIVRTSAAPSQR
jgi:hypothetical protein